MNFPSLPSNGDTYTFGTKTWRWNGVAWDVVQNALQSADIPNLDTAKITSGVFADARIPNLDTAKITSGVFADARIPNLDTAKITSGVFDVARIPVLPSQSVQVSSGAISALTVPQQTAIVQGTVVTTTDGRRWVYNTGTKTLEASYIELADISPEWSAVANKPAFAPIATSGSAADLSTGTILATRMPALTGDITTSAGAVATTLATVNGNVGSFGSATAVPIITVNAKGLVTAVTTSALGTSAIVNTGTSGAAIPLLNGTNTWSGTQTLVAGTTTVAPLRFQAGVVLTSAVAHSLEWDGTNLFATQATGPTRKTIAYTDSSLTGSTSGSAATLTTGRTIGITGDLVWTSPSFNGSSNVTAAGTIQPNVVDNTKLAQIATQTFKGRATASTGNVEDLTVSQAKTMLGLIGTNSGDQTITLTGDITGSGTGSFATTLATVNGNVGSFGSATAVPIITVNAKGLVTAASSATITPAWGSITAKPTTISGYGITDALGLTGGTLTGTLVLPAGTTVLAPLRFQAGAVQTTPVAHSLEWDGTNLFATQATGPTRKTIAYTDSNITGSAATLTTGRTIAITGDLTWTSPSFNGSGNITAAGTLATVATAGTYRSVTINAKGLVTSGTNPTTLANYGIIASDILANLLTADGAGSSLDADLLDGQQGSFYAPIASPTFTGIPAAPTAAAATNTTQIATTAFVTTADNLKANVGGGNATGTWPISVSGSAASVTTLTLGHSASSVSLTAAMQNQLGYVAGVSLLGQSDGGLYQAGFDTTNWRHQIFGDFRTGQILIRGQNNGTFQSWRTVWDSGNDGAGSTLDADLLDGQQGAWYAPIASPTFTGTVTMPAFTITSDRRLKTSIEPLKDYGKFIDATNVYSFVKDGKHQFGVLAQEAQKIRPEVVSIAQDVDLGEVLTVNPMDYLFALVAEVQDLRKRLAELETR